jgi:hypothetical protein
VQTPAPPYSAFIDGLAWTTLVVSVLAIPMSLLLLLASSGPTTDVREALALSGINMALPDSVVFIFKHLKTISLLLLVFAAFSVASSMALLKRRNWARIAFIAMLALNIAANIVGLVYAFLSPVTQVTANGLPAASQLPVDGMMRIAMGLNALLVIGLSIAMAWMVKRLMSDAIRSEFSPPLR